MTRLNSSNPFLPLARLALLLGLLSACMPMSDPLTRSFAAQPAQATLPARPLPNDVFAHLEDGGGISIETGRSPARVQVWTGNGCNGHVSGSLQPVATHAGSGADSGSTTYRLTSWMQPGRAQCVLTLDHRFGPAPDGSHLLHTLRVVDQRGCASYHGSACPFTAYRNTAITNREFR